MPPPSKQRKKAKRKAQQSRANAAPVSTEDPTQAPLNNGHAPHLTPHHDDGFAEGVVPPPPLPAAGDRGGGGTQAATWDLGADAAATAHDLLATASDLYRRMAADHPGALPDDDACFSSLPAHLRTFIRNALPLGQLPSSNHPPPKMSAAAMQAVAQQIANATRYPPASGGGNAPAVPAFDFSDPSVRFALEQLGPPHHHHHHHHHHGADGEEYDEEYYSDEDADSVDGAEGEYTYHSGVIYDSGVIPLTAPPPAVNTPATPTIAPLSNGFDAPLSAKKKKNKKKKKGAAGGEAMLPTAPAQPVSAPLPSPPPPAQPIPPPPASNPPPSSRAVGKQPMAYAPPAATRPAAPAKPAAKPAPAAQAKAPTNKKIWSTNSSEERERIKEFWLGLTEEERRRLVKVEKEAVLRKMKEQQKHSCACAVCGRKRAAIEDELEVLYDAYYDELEQYATHQQQHVLNPSAIPPPPGPGPFPGSVELDKNGELVRGSFDPAAVDEEEELEDEYDDEEDEDDYDDDDAEDDASDEGDEEDEEEEDDQAAPSRNSRIKPKRGPGDLFTSSFGKSFTVQGGILTVADDLLKNDGQKFLEMMETLAERRMQREEEAAQGLEESDEEDEDEEDEDEEEEDEEDEEDEDEDEDDDDRMEEGRRMFQIFAARMFEQRVLQAYREKVAQERQLELLRELEEEDRLAADREAKKAKENQKKKDKKKQQKLQKEQAEAERRAAQLAEQEAARAKAEAAQEAARAKQEAERVRREAERKAKEEEKARKEEERRKQLELQREREAEKERKRKEREEKAKAEREAKEKERKEKEAERERLAKEERERAERERKAKEEEARREAQRKEKEAAEKAAQAKLAQQQANVARQAASRQAVLNKPSPAPAPSPVSVPRPPSAGPPRPPVTLPPNPLAARKGKQPSQSPTPLPPVSPAAAFPQQPPKAPQAQRPPVPPQMQGPPRPPPQGPAQPVQFQQQPPQPQFGMQRPPSRVNMGPGLPPMPPPMPPYPMASTSALPARPTAAPIGPPPAFGFGAIGSPKAQHINSVPGFGVPPQVSPVSPGPLPRPSSSAAFNHDGMLSPHLDSDPLLKGPPLGLPKPSPTPALGGLGFGPAPIGAPAHSRRASQGDAFVARPPPFGAVGRPTPPPAPSVGAIGRPSGSSTPTDGTPRPEADKVSKPLGSSALVGDDEPVERVPRRPSQHVAPVSGQWGVNGDAFGGLKPLGGSTWSTPTLGTTPPLPSIGATSSFATPPVRPGQDIWGASSWGGPGLFGFSLPKPSPTPNGTPAPPAPPAPSSYASPPPLS